MEPRLCSYKPEESIPRPVSIGDGQAHCSVCHVVLEFAGDLTTGEVVGVICPNCNTFWALIIPNFS